MAGMGTRDIKRRIKSVSSTRQITKAMELVSTAKLKRAKDRMDVTKPYFEKVIETVQSILEAEKGLKHDFTDVRPVKNVLYIVITADRGLCGGYNINALKASVEDMENTNKVKLITVGKKAVEFYKKVGIKPEREVLYISEKPTYMDAQEIAREALKLYTTEAVDEIKLVYTRLVSTISQEPTILQLLPIARKEETVETTVDDDEFVEIVSYEPSPEDVLSYIIPKYVESTIFGGLVESSAAEQAARRMAMESASDNADEMIDELTLSFNQARQAAITQEISEIVSGADALG